MTLDVNDLADLTKDKSTFQCIMYQCENKQKLMNSFQIQYVKQLNNGVNPFKSVGS